MPKKRLTATEELIKEISQFDFSLCQKQIFNNDKKRRVIITPRKWGKSYHKIIRETPRIQEKNEN